MKVEMVFRLEWDRPGGEDLADFRKKYQSFKDHVEIMQLKGMLPMGEIRWELGTHRQKKIMVAPDPDGGGGSPAIAHVGGNRLM